MIDVDDYTQARGGTVPPCRFVRRIGGSGMDGKWER
jgi:hypothetical protein